MQKSKHVIFLLIIFLIANSQDKQTPIPTQIHPPIQINISQINSNQKNFIQIPTTIQRNLYPPFNQFTYIFHAQILNTTQSNIKNKCIIASKQQNKIVQNHANISKINTEFIQAILIKDKSNKNQAFLYALDTQNGLLIYQIQFDAQIDSQIKPIQQYNALIQCNEKSIQSSCSFIAPEYAQSFYKGIYLLKDKKLTELIFDQNKKQVTSKPISFQGPNVSIDSTQQIQKVIMKDQSTIYIQTRDKVVRVSFASSYPQTFLIYQVSKQDVNGTQQVQQELVDMSIDSQSNKSDSMVLIDRKKGIIYIQNIQNLSKIIKTPAQFSYAFQKVNLKSKTILITLNIHHKNFIAEIFIEQLTSSDDKEFILTLNKYYDRFARFDKLYLFDNNFGAIASAYRYDFFAYSINRQSNSHYFPKSYSLFRQTSQYIVKIIPIAVNIDIDRPKQFPNPQINNENQENLKGQGVRFLLVQYNKWSVTTITNFDQNILRCDSTEQLNGTLIVQYTGTCKQSQYSPKTHFCALKKSYDMHFLKLNKDLVDLNEKRHQYLWGIAGALFGLLVVLFVICWRRLKKLEIILRQKWQKRHQSTSGTGQQIAN